MDNTSVARGIRQIWPLVLGMAFARAGLIVSGYGSYQNTDEGLFTDGAMLIALAVMLVLFVILGKTKVRVSLQARWMLFAFAVVAEALCIVLLCPDPAFSLPAAFRMPLCALVTLASSACQFSWLIHMRKGGAFLTALFAFGSLGASEVEIYVCYLLGDMGYYLAVVLVLAQAACAIAAQGKISQGWEVTNEEAYEFVAYAKDTIQNSKLLCITAVGLVLIYFVDGLLRGYPTGAPISFTHPTRTINMLLTIALCAVIIGATRIRRFKPMSPATYISLELLAACALLLYALFPDALDIGAVLTTTLNALLCALMWYMVVAFTTFGWRDPYYYCLGAWIVCMGSRAIARVLLVQVNLGVQDELAISAFMFASLLVSTQVLLFSFYESARGTIAQAAAEHGRVEAELRGEINELNRRLVDMELAGNPINCANCGRCKRDSAAAGEKALSGKQAGGGMLSRIMGLDKPVVGEASPQATMRSRAEAVGRQFMLSEREVEVLSYYAMGWTQKRVAEELFIQPATVHAHIKRIYAKTGLHSRQEVLDFMEKYLG